MQRYRKNTKRSYTAKKCEKHKTTKHHVYVIPYTQGDFKLGYRFFFPEGTTIGQIRRVMRDIARRLGFTPEELYAPDALNLPELLTVPEMRRCFGK